MKKVSLLASVLAMSTTLASAAEVAVVSGPTCPPPACPCPKAFQGFYLGGSAGYGIAAVRTYMQRTNHWDKTKIAAQGFDGGVLFGYNYVFNNKFGLGLEAYFNWASTSGRHSGQVTNTAGGYQYNASMKNSVQIRVPFSYVIANLVAPKVVVGWDNSSWGNTFNINQGAFARSRNTRFNGFLWGFGVDFLLAKHVISGLEYTGIISQNTTLTSTNGSANVNFRPLYNTFKATIKFIY